MVVGRVQIEDDLAEGSMFEYGITDQVAMPVSGTKTVATSSSKSSEEPNSDRTNCTAHRPRGSLPFSEAPMP